MKLYCFYDTKSARFTAPWPSWNDQTAKRDFEERCNDANHAFGKYPEDYQLWFIAEFSDSTAQLDQVERKSEIICKGIEVYHAA